ncbi:MAG: hypothetical protein ACXWID_13780 [Pyrinomonadaceae bacterium]
MVTSSKKKVSKKKSPKKMAADDPPIIVGGGGSEIIKIRADLLVTPMTPASGYARFRVQGVNIKSVNVFDGSNNHPHPVSSAGNKVTFSE